MVPRTKKRTECRNLIDQVWSCNLEGLRHYVEELGCDMSKADNPRNLPIVLASMRPCPRTLEYLLEHGANPNVRVSYEIWLPDGTKVSVPPYEIKGVEVPCCGAFKIKIDEVCGYSGLTPLHIAVYAGRPENVELLLKHGADPNVLNEEGYSPLHCAILAKRYDIAETLLKHGADPNIRGKKGKTPLHLAVLKEIDKDKFTLTDDDVRAIELLLKHGANTNVKDDKGKTPLAYLIEEYRLGLNKDAIKLLLDHGADLKEVKNPVIRMLMYPEVIKLLLQYGADPNEIDMMGDKTALHHAIRDNITIVTYHYDSGRRTEIKWNVDATKILLEAGADPNAKDKSEGKTPLHYAVEYPLVDAVKLLLENGADPNAQDEKGETPMHIAFKQLYEPHFREFRNEYLKIIELLAEYGGDPRILNKERRPAIILAFEHKDFEPLEAIRRGLIKKEQKEQDKQREGNISMYY